MVEFKTKLNENSARTFQKYQLKKIMILMILVSVLLIVLGVVSLFIQKDKENQYFSYYFIVFGVLFGPTMILVSSIVSKRNIKSNPLISENTEVLFQFDEEKVVVKTIKGDDFNSILDCKYNYLFRMEETKTHYILYLNINQANMIDKAGLTQGNLEEFNKILHDKMGTKFVSRVK